ncbi:MAG: nucleoside deaminase [Candidatus Marinimicrobia bacterium]|nr:nucleoside deaminase [Candidatus Neomarinimicrobiota bacterium]
MTSTTHQCEQLKDPTAHAEMIAITSASNTLSNWRLTDCELYVTKEPCTMCAGAIMNSRISYVGFGVYDEQSGCCGSLYQLCREPRFNHQSVVQGGLLEDECMEFLDQFFQKKRK